MCKADHVLLKLQGLIALCRGISFNTNFVGGGCRVYNVQAFGTSSAVHSNPNYFSLQASDPGAYLTLEDSSGAIFATQSLWLAGNYNNGCDATFTISGSTNGGPPIPTCAVAPFILGGHVDPVQIVFDPPCLATTVTITSSLAFCPGSVITLDDVTVCAISSTSGIYNEQAPQ